MLPQLPSGWAQPLPTFTGLKPEVSNGFVWPSHKGVDLMYRRPTPGEPELPWMTKQWEMFDAVPVCAIGPGRVWGIDKATGTIIVDHHKVFGVGPLASQYSHLNMDHVLVSVGDQVETGTIMGFVGYTGTDVAHLHFALSTDVKRKWGVDPKPVLAQLPFALSKSEIRPSAAALKRQSVGKDLGWLILLLLIAIVSSKQ